MVISGTSQIKVVVDLDVAQQFLTKSGDLVTKIEYRQYLDSNGQIDSLKFAFGKKRNSKGNFGSKVIFVDSWAWADLGANREEIVAKINKEFDNVSRIMGGGMIN
jgi:hypothetical protein